MLIVVATLLVLGLTDDILLALLAGAAMTAVLILSIRGLAW